MSPQTTPARAAGVRGGARNRRPALALAAGLLAAGLLAAPAAHAQFTFTLLDAPGAINTRAFGINAAGRIVGEYSVLVGGVAVPRSFVYDAGTFTPFAPLGALQTHARGVNDAGQISGFYFGPGETGFVGFRYDAGAVTSLRVPGAVSTFAYGINARGQVAGEASVRRFGAGFETDGFVYDAGTYTPVAPAGPPGTFDVRPRGINAAGQVVGAYLGRGTPFSAFVFDGGTFTPFRVPGSTLTAGEGINDLGHTVGWYDDARGRHGFLYAGGAFTTFDVPGATQTFAYGINAAGQIVGEYTDVAGRRRAFLAATTVVPEPASLALVAAGAGVVGVVARRRRRT
jgi:probable HAF family extracellular repeat protein